MPRKSDVREGLAQGLEASPVACNNFRPDILVIVMTGISGRNNCKRSSSETDVGEEGLPIMIQKSGLLETCITHFQGWSILQAGAKKNLQASLRCKSKDLMLKHCELLYT